MNLWQTLTAPWRTAQRKYDATLDLFADLFGSGAMTRAGERVTTDTALQVSAVFACLRVLSEGVAQVPLKLMRNSGNRREVASDHPLHPLLHGGPNEAQTSFEWRETVLLHAALAGNHYSLIVRGRGGNIDELIPVPPAQMEAKRDASGERKFILTTDDGRVIPLAATDVLHVRGPSWNGWLGMDVLKSAREAIGLSAAAERSTAQQFGNGVQVRGVYTVDGKLNDEQYRGLRRWLLEHTSGKFAGAPLVLDRNAKFTPTTMTGVDAQTIEQRKMQVEEVCRFFRVMPIMVGLADKTATYASSEQMFLAHVVHTLMPWYSRIEQTIDKQLLTARERESGLYAHFVAQGLMRGSMRDRSEFYAKALGAGGAPAWITQDEIRALEELNPMGGAAARLPEPTNVGTNNRPAAAPARDDARIDDTPED